MRRATSRAAVPAIFPSDFYPRSPCGERLRICRSIPPRRKISIHALLAESDVSERELQPQTWNFYPRSPCGERLVRLAKLCEVALFLSTLSLRRATGVSLKIRPELLISIHALLAESDCNEIAGRNPPIHFYPRSPCGERRPPKPHKQVPALFLSTLSLRRATDKVLEAVSRNGISIHALLAESDQIFTA